jgi:hypothetical protein
MTVWYNPVGLVSLVRELPARQLLLREIGRL